MYFFFLLIIKGQILFLTSPTPPRHQTAYAFFDQNRVKNRKNRTFFPHYLIRQTGGPAYVFFFLLVIYVRILFLTPPRTFFPQYQIRPLGGLTYIKFFSD